jgi:hypothetical protein
MLWDQSLTKHEDSGLMGTECITQQLEFHGFGRRDIVGQFDGGKISSDGGGILLREVEQRTHILRRLSRCFVDHRNPKLIEHSLESLIKQRVMGIALGYEDLNDHDALRDDPLLTVLSDKTGRAGTVSRGAGKSTLNRLELTPLNATSGSRYKKIAADSAAMDALLIDLFLESFTDTPEEIVLDVDATDDPVHGKQEGRFFHGYYRSYCYLPLYIFCGEQLLCARLRTADQDGAAGTVDELVAIVGRIRAVWPEVRIILRGDSGFCRNEIMDWCEANRVDYVLGLAKNSRLKNIIEDEMAQAKQHHELSGKAARVFKDFRYQTRKSWSRERRVVGKAEHLSKGENPRFIVSSISPEQQEARTLYEELYCARGDMENRIKEQQMALFADRTSCHELHANQLRLYFSSFAYVLLQTLRRLGLKGTALAKAQSDTIRLKLLKIGTRIRVSVRKVWLSFSESYPYAALFRQVFGNLQKIPLRC